MSKRIGKKSQHNSDSDLDFSKIEFRSDTEDEIPPKPIMMTSSVSIMDTSDIQHHIADKIQLKNQAPVLRLSQHNHEMASADSHQRRDMFAIKIPSQRIRRITGLLAQPVAKIQIINAVLAYAIREKIYDADTTQITPNRDLATALEVKKRQPITLAQLSEKIN